MAEMIDKWWVVDKLTAIENEFQDYKPFHGFEHAMYRKVVEVEMEVGKAPCVEMKPVVHAHWIDTGDSYEDKHCRYNYWECSACENRIAGRYGLHDYCPNCGAHMDEEVADA